MFFEGCRIATEFAFVRPRLQLGFIGLTVNKTPNAALAQLYDIKIQQITDTQVR
jgi:hypothetical protein